MLNFLHWLFIYVTVIDTAENSSTEPAVSVPSSSKGDSEVKNSIAACINTSKEAASVEEKEEDTSADGRTTASCRETVQFRVVWNKKHYEVAFALDESADNLKKHIERLTGTFIYLCGL